MPVYGLPRMRSDYRPLFALNAVWGYGWLLAGLGLVLHAWRHAPARDNQWLVFMLVMAVPWVANAAYLVLGWRLLGRDPTPLGVAAALIGFAWLIRRQQFFKVLPLAHRLLFTELPNRRALAQRFDTEATRWRGSGRPHALALLDIDHFKRINDTRGHAGGDIVLRELGGVLRAVPRQGRGALPGAGGAVALMPA